MDKQALIRQADKSDIPAIQKFLSGRVVIHRHLDWREPWNWACRTPYLLLLNKNKEIDAILCCTSEINNNYWVRLFAFKKSLGYFQIWNSLFFEVLSVINSQSENPHIITLAYNDWMIELLELEGWAEVERVIQLEWTCESNSNFTSFSPHPLIRQMKKEDIPIVHAIDTASFQPYWQQSIEAIEAAFEQSAYSTIFYEGQIVKGFQISTAGTNKAHLARIAVQPEYRRQHIGKQLVLDLSMHCVENKIPYLSVNTQVSNACSIALYDKMRFQKTGNTFPIFSY